MTANRGRAARRRARLLATGLTLTGGLVAAVPGGAAAAAAAAATCVSMTASQSPGPADTRLTGVAVRSPCDALAVGTISGGDSGPGRTLVQHWDGAHWTQVPSQDPGSTDNRLFSVAATSATSAWAVGDFADSTGQYQTLIERLDGSKWTRIDSPAPGQKSDLFAVAATSATNAWAVGSYVPAGADPDATQTLIEHWDGTSWSLSPQSAGSLPGLLAGVSGTGWAVGYQPTSESDHPLIEHWNGRVWSVVPAADQDLQGLLGVSATSPTDIWAVGWMGSPTGLHTAVEHYDGTGWTRSPSPGSAFLLGVAAASPADAWAVGWDFDGHAVILHYDGTGWVPVPAAVPNFGILAGVAASSPGSVWAVGGPLTSDQFGPVALHLRCC